MNIIIIIQARMGSSRLPGKVLLPLGKDTVLGHVINRCHKLNSINKVIIATSDLGQDDPIAEWALQNQIVCYRGSEDNVLKRYYDCAKEYNPDYIIRVTSDCPYLDYELAQQTIDKMISEPSDIIFYEHTQPLIRGLAVELFSFDTLKKIYNCASEGRHTEHVTYYAYEFSEQFNTSTLKVPDTIVDSKLRLTVDTEEDYMLCREIEDNLENASDLSSSEIIEFLKLNPQIASINEHIEQKPVV